MSNSADDLAQARTSLAKHRSHLANERTHLAYLRTAVAFLGFGITLNRFAIYLIQNSHAKGASSGIAPLADVKHVGLGMVLAGVAVILWAIYRYNRASHDIEAVRRHRDRRAIMVMSIGLVLLGASVAIWLFVT